MSNALDDFVERLQNQIFEETREAFGELGFQRWRNPQHRGLMPEAGGHGRVTGRCGDTIELFLKFENERVTRATFMTDGCGSSTVCGSLAAELALGKNPDELTAVTGEKILEVLGRFPKEEEHCAFLAAESLQNALDDYMRKQIAPTESDQTSARSEIADGGKKQKGNYERCGSNRG
jgi:nitrogen fixation NifU-like protein